MAFHPRERRRAAPRSSSGCPPTAPPPPASARRCSPRAAATTTRRGRGRGRRSSCRRPDDPATLPTFDDIPAIEDGLAPESGTLKVYNYEEYISPDVLAAFEEEFGVKVEVTTFTSMDEAVAKLASGEVDFDVFFPTPDRVGQLAAGELLQPLNKSYLPNLTNVWESLQDPFYDQGGVYTVPYTLYTTGHRLPHRRRGQDARRVRRTRTTSSGTRPTAARCTSSRTTARCSGWRCCGATPTPTSTPRTPSSIDAALADVVRADRPRQRQGRRRGLHRAAGEAGLGPPVLVGDVVNAQYYLPEGESIDNIGYWYPPTRRIIGSDAIAVLPARRSPVLAHAFLELPARRRPRPGELRLARLPAAAERRSTPRASSPTSTCRPTWRRRHPAGGLRRRASSCCSSRLAGEQRLGRRLVEVHRRWLRLDRAARPRVAATARLWPALAAPGVVWLVALFVVPFYGVLAVAFGGVDPIFGNAVPVWNPLRVGLHVVRRRPRARLNGRARRRCSCARSSTSARARRSAS